ncbi:MAG: hypothetical protein EOO51_15080 [Flavobacterium sp.]|nr:MAG: hypothetical protein EOO51_15080 [Flavobacterium sp.]
MKSIFLIFLFSILTAAAQNNKHEFVGLVKFAHTVVATDKDYNPDNDYAAIGRHSDYYFKDGDIKWLTYDSYFRMDLFRAKENRDYYLTNRSDSIFTPKNNDRDFDIISYNVLKSDRVILGHKCRMVELKLKPLGRETPVTYRRYYFSSDFYIDPEKLAKCTSSGYDVIYGQMKSIPLRIEFEFPGRTVVWEATEIKPMNLETSFFELAKGTPVWSW